MITNVYSTQSIMSALENLTVSLDSFVLTVDQQIIIKSKMKRCKCRRWHFIENFHNDLCPHCFGPDKKPSNNVKKSKRHNPRNKNLKSPRVLLQSNMCSEIIYISLKNAMENGLTLNEALFENAISVATFKSLPPQYKKTLFDTRNTHIALLAKNK